MSDRERFEAWLTTNYPQATDLLRDSLWKEWQGKQATKPVADSLHAVICQAVTHMNIGENNEAWHLLREALANYQEPPAQATQEPVAWTFHVREKRNGTVFSREFVSFDFVPTEGEEIISKTPLYEATPPASVEPVAWANSKEFHDALTRGQSFNGWHKKYSDCDMALYATTPPAELDMVSVPRDPTPEERAHDLAWALAKDDGEDPNQLIWEYSEGISQPWGDVYLRYLPQAERLLKLIADNRAMIGIAK